METGLELADVEKGRAPAPALIHLDDRAPLRAELSAAKTALRPVEERVAAAKAAKAKALEDHGRRQNPFPLNSGDLLALNREIDRAEHELALATARLHRAEREWAEIDAPERKAAAGKLLIRLHGLADAETEKWAKFGGKLGELRDLAKEAIELRRARGEILFDNSSSSLRDWLAKQIMLALRDVAAEDHNSRGIWPDPVAPTSEAWREYFGSATRPAPGVELG